MGWQYETHAGAADSLKNVKFQHSCAFIKGLTSLANSICNISHHACWKPTRLGEGEQRCGLHLHSHDPSFSMIGQLPLCFAVRSVSSPHLSGQDRQGQCLEF